MQTINEIITKLEKLQDEFGESYKPEIYVQIEKLNPEGYIDRDDYATDSISAIYGDVIMNYPINMNY